MQRQFKSILLFIAVSFITFTGCKKDESATAIEGAQSINSELVTSAASANRTTPPFNLEVILRGEDNAFGLVKFRQDNDLARIVDLNVWVRDLEPNNSYLLQRAVDTNLDGNCTSTTWLTLGKGLVPQAIVTDAKGTGRADLFRNLSAVPTGQSFDIHFQVIDAATRAVVLTSDCYRFTVR